MVRRQSLRASRRARSLCAEVLLSAAAAHTYSRVPCPAFYSPPPPPPPPPPHRSHLLPEFDSPREASDALNSFACRRCVCTWLELPPGEQEFSSSSVVTNPSVISTWELEVTVKAAVSGASTYWYIHVESDSNASGGDYIPDENFLATPFNTADPDDDGDPDEDGDGFGDGSGESDGFGDDSGDGFGDGGDSFGDGDGDSGDSDDGAKRPPQPPAAASKDGGAASMSDAGDAERRAQTSLEVARAEWRKRGEAAAFDLTTKLVHEDCAEANRLPGVRAGYSYASPSSPVYVWLAIDLSTRYHIDPIRADALMMDDELYCVQRLEFGDRYVKTERAGAPRAGGAPGGGSDDDVVLKPAEVYKHACGQSDVLYLEQPKLIFERGAAALQRSRRLAAFTTTAGR